MALNGRRPAELMDGHINLDGAKKIFLIEQEIGAFSETFAFKRPFHGLARVVNVSEAQGASVNINRPSSQRIA